MVKSSKKALAVLLAVACLITFMPAMASQSFAAKKLTVKPAKKTIYVKKSVTLKANQKVKWSASKASLKVVKLTSKKAKSIKVTGKKAGKAVVTAKVGKQTKKVTITVKKAKAAVKKTAVTAVAISADNAGDPAPKVGDTLTAQLKDKDGNVVKADATYQWYRTTTETESGKSAIVGETGSTYTVQVADEGKTLYVVATVNGKEIASKATAYVTTQKLEKVAITGMSGNSDKDNNKVNDIAVIGDTLKAETTPASAAGMLKYQWYRNGAAIQGATAQEYTLVAADASANITVTTAAKTEGAISNAALTSKAVFANKALDKVATVQIKKIAASKLKAFVTEGTKTLTTSDVTYQWYTDEVKDAKKVSGGSSDNVTIADATKTYIVVVTGKNEGYYGKLQADNAGTATKLDSAATITSDANSDAVDGIGNTLTATVKAADNVVAADKVTFQWQKDGVDIAGATSDKYTLTKADADDAIHTYSVNVTAKAPLTGTATGTYTLKAGIAKDSATEIQRVSFFKNDEKTALTTDSNIYVGDVLQAKATPEAATEVLAYTWTVTKDNKAKTFTGSSYTVKDTDEGATITVAAKYGPDTKDAWYVGATANANETTAVDVTGGLTFKAVQAGIGTLTLTYDNNKNGNTKATGYATDKAPVVGHYIHAALSTNQTISNIKWYRDYDKKVATNTEVGTANQPYYQPTKDDLGHTITAVVTDGNGAETTSAAVIANTLTLKKVEVVESGSTTAVNTLQAGKTYTVKVTGSDDEVVPTDDYEVVWDGTKMDKTSKAQSYMFDGTEGVVTVKVTPDGANYVGDAISYTFDTAVAVNSTTTTHGITLAAGEPSTDKKVTVTLSSKVSTDLLKNVTWYIDGVQVTGSGKTLVVDQTSAAQTVVAQADINGTTYTAEAVTVAANA